MNLTFGVALNSVRVNHRAKYLDQRSFSSKVVVQTHTLDRLLYLDH